MPNFDLNEPVTVQLNKSMIKLESFEPSDFNELISWIDSPELLVTIAGYDFTYPLTVEQLQNYLDIKNSKPFKILNAEGKSIGHAELVLTGNDSCKIDKLLIGHKSDRGNGTGTLVMKELVSYAFRRLHVHIVELNVFDWNIAGIQCYRKTGFAVNAAKKSSFEVNGNSWVTINMTLSRANWELENSSYSNS